MFNIHERILYFKLLNTSLHFSLYNTKEGDGLFSHGSSKTIGNVIPIGDLMHNVRNINILSQIIIIIISHLEDGLHVVRPDILVLEVVGVLPHVDPEERNQASSGLQWVLVSTGCQL